LHRAGNGSLTLLKMLRRTTPPHSSKSDLQHPSLAFIPADVNRQNSMAGNYGSDQADRLRLTPLHFLQTHQHLQMRERKSEHGIDIWEAQEELAPPHYFLMTFSVLCTSVHETPAVFHDMIYGSLLCVWFTCTCGI